MKDVKKMSTDELRDSLAVYESCLSRGVSDEVRISEIENELEQRAASSITRNNYDGQLDLIWNALHFYREHGIPEGDLNYDDEWSDICSAMAWIKEDLDSAYHGAEERCGYDED